MPLTLPLATFATMALDDATKPIPPSLYWLRLAGQPSLMNKCEGCPPEPRRAEARRLLGELDGARGDRAALILLGGEPMPVVFPATSDLAQVDRALADVEANDGPMQLATLTSQGLGGWVFYDVVISRLD